MYLIDEDTYERLKQLNESKIPSQIRLNQEQSKFVKDRTKDDVQTGNLWSKIVEKIQPLLNASQVQPVQPVQPDQSAQSAQPLKSILRRPTFTPSQEHPRDSSFWWDDYAPDDSLTPTRNLQEEFEREAGAVGGDPFQQQQQQQLSPDRPSLIERDRRQSVLGDVLKNVPKRFRSRVIVLFRMLSEQPGVRINDDKILVNGVRQHGETALVLADLVNPKRKLTYHNPDLIKVLSKINDILFTVQNQEATWLIVQESKLEGTPLNTPVTVKRNPRSKKNVTPAPQKKGRGDTPRIQREGMRELENWGKQYGMDIDTSVELPKDLAQELVLNKRGKGKIHDRLPKIKWQTVF